ncbi:hypothetical protein [Methylocystis sp. ATCC 49242]|nr:hypothetical protein [Methylocystis sp. ATCC 49242]
MIEEAFWVGSDEAMNPIEQRVTIHAANLGSLTPVLPSRTAASDSGRRL